MKGLLRSGAIILLMLVAMLTYARRENSGAWIAFTSNRDGPQRIYLMTGDGDSVQQLVPDTMCGSWPQWSPDGTWISFSTYCEDLDGYLVRIRPGGSTPQLLDTEPPFSNLVTWSPDSEQLLAEYNESDIYIVDADFSNERILSRVHFAAQWSLDGEWVYAHPYYNENSSLDRIHVTTGHIETLIPSRTIVGTLSWSPDGTQVVFAMRVERGDDLFTMASYGGAPQRISHDLRFEYIIQPKWSPDGEWIAFTAELPSSARNIYRIRPDGRDFEQLTLTTDFIHSIQWSSDSEWLLVDQHYEGKRNILRLRVKDSTVENLTSGISFDYAPQYAPVAGLDWRPILLIFCALGMFIVSLVWRFRI